MSKAQKAKYQGKKYKALDAKWEIEDNQGSMTYTADEEPPKPAAGAEVKPSTVAGYVVDVQLAYVKEDNAYSCFAEFFKISKKQVDFKAYSAARKDAEDGADEGENVDEIIPKYPQNKWDGLPLGEKFALLEPYIDMASDFDIEMDDIDKFIAEIKTFGIDIPASIKADLKK
ncbi:MAG: hypothetical protein JW839_14535 [Candidatus Lokiarchaeota archaeon]|nr:hypothetical protein [Candidatus Lokiarchaeota archaeon]